MVLLPEPDSPTRPRVSPRMTLRETPWMTRVEPKSLIRSRASSRGVGCMRLLQQGYRRGLFGCWRREGAGVVADDLPAGRSLFDDEEEVAVGVASTGGSAVEVETAGDGSEAGVERLDLELREGELAHGFGVGVGGLVVGEHLRVAVLDGAAHEEDVGGVFVASGEGVEVAAIPVVGGLVEDVEDGAGFGCGSGLGDCGEWCAKEQGEGQAVHGGLLKENALTLRAPGEPSFAKGNEAGAKG